jgi:pimeloyl-ACP methyl ester carboxylesterase
MSFAQIDGINTYYSVSGNGSPVVLIHHLAGNTKSWLNQIPYLSQDYHVIAYDLRGHGRSAESNRVFTMDDLAEDLFLLLQALGVSKCSVIGHSIGGMIAPLFALKHESMINSLIIIAGASQPLAQDKLASYGAMREISRTKGMEALAEYRRENGQIPPKITNDRLLWEHFKNLYKETSVQGYIRMSEALATMPNLTNRLKELSCPILGVVGDLDPVFMEMMKILSENAKVSLRVMHNCGHFVMMEEPDEFNKIITNFLNTYNLK